MIGMNAHSMAKGENVHGISSIFEDQINLMVDWNLMQREMGVEASNIPSMQLPKL